MRRTRDMGGVYLDRLRRYYPFPRVVAGGGGITDPSSLSQIWEWWEPWRLGLSNGASITTLTGQKNGRHFSESNATNKPTFDTGTSLGSKGTARFAGNPHEFSTGPDMSAITTAAHLFILIKADNDPAAATASSGIWIMGTDNSGNRNDTYPFTDGTLMTGALTTNRINMCNPTVSLTNWILFEISNETTGVLTYTYTAILHKTDGTNENIYGPITGNPVALPAAPKLGKDPDGLWLLGNVAGMYLADAKMTTQKTQLISYINSTFSQTFA